MTNFMELGAGKVLTGLLRSIDPKLKSTYVFYCLLLQEDNFFLVIVRCFVWHYCVYRCCDYYSVAIYSIIYSLLFQCDWYSGRRETIFETTAIAVCRLCGSH